LPPGIKDSRRQRIAVDLTSIPYHRQPHKDPDEIRRGEAKWGTTHFHCDASAYVIGHKQRVTLVLTYVHNGEALSVIVTRLLERLKGLDVEPKRLFLDREFFNVEMLGLLKLNRFTTFLPMPVRGKRLRSLLKGRRSYGTSYEVCSPKHGKEGITIYVVCRYAKGRRGLHRAEQLPYAVIGGFDRPVPEARQEPRSRFGVDGLLRTAAAPCGPVSSRTGDRRGGHGRQVPRLRRDPRPRGATQGARPWHSFSHLRRARPGHRRRPRAQARDPDGRDRPMSRVRPVSKGNNSRPSGQVWLTREPTGNG
jgi:hypothetical protein